MYEIELMILGLALGLAIGEFSVYYLIFEKSFVDRFKKFNEAIQSKLIQDSREFIVKFIHELEDEKTDPAGLIEFTNKWSARQSVALDILKRWSEISRFNIWIIISCFMSAMCVGAHALIRSPILSSIAKWIPFTYLHFAVLFLALEIFYILVFLLKFSVLSQKVSKYELGESLEKMLDEEVVRLSK